MNTETTPNPGSREAGALGCVCPVLDNAHGRGYYGGVRDANGSTVFVTRPDCRLHGEALTAGQKYDSPEAPQ